MAGSSEIEGELQRPAWAEDSCSSEVLSGQSFDATMLDLHRKVGAE